MQRFAGKSVLVTGGTTGIGQAVAAAFLREGAMVVVTGRSAEAGASALGALRKVAATVDFIQGDASVEADVQRWVETTVRRYGKLDVAVNNAGVEGELAPIAAQSGTNYDRVFDVNVKGVLLSLKHEIAAMQNTGGAIVNTSSMVGQIGMAGASVYAASKHAVNGLTRTAALETAKAGIRVNAVAPGAVHTPMMERFTGGNAEMQAGFAAMHPVGRTGTPAEIAEAVLYLASDAARFTTGAVLNVDGGFTVQ